MEQRPLGAVLADLHWADHSSGLRRRAGRAGDGRADARRRHVAAGAPASGAGWRRELNATTLALTPLSDAQTALLLGHLLDRPVRRQSRNRPRSSVRAEPARRRAVRRALPRERVGRGARAAGDVAGNHRARLDGLPKTRRRYGNAAVVGKVLWVSSLDRDRGEALASLQSLERKGSSAGNGGRRSRRERARVRPRSRAGRRVRPAPASRPRREAPACGGVDGIARTSGGRGGDAASTGGRPSTSCERRAAGRRARSPREAALREAAIERSR